ncbi:hypothetical protein HaLaN_29756, partial [Haematococcus lacustris]
AGGFIADARDKIAAVGCSCKRACSFRRYPGPDAATANTILMASAARARSHGGPGACKERFSHPVSVSRSDLQVGFHPCFYPRRRHREKEDFNQYWYSSHTISKIVQGAHGPSQLACQHDRVKLRGNTAQLP